MKILVLTKKMPFPLKDGESIAVHNLTKAMVDNGIEVDLLSMNTSKHFVEIDAVRSQIPQYKNIVTSFIDNKINKIEALKNLFSRDSYHIVRFDYPDFREKLSMMLKSKAYDCVFLESVYLTPYIKTIRKYSEANVVMRAHNVEHEIWHRISKQTSDVFKKLYLNIQVGRLKKYEFAAIKKLDGLISFTQRDHDFFRDRGYQGSAMISPIGIDTASFPDVDLDTRFKTIGFIGSLDWQPNIEGLRWFLKTIWPLVLKRHPKAEFHIAGRSPVKEILEISSKNVTVHGEVESATDFVSRYPIAVVPLLSGGGMRVKILEAMALKRAIISTSVGAEGITLDGISIADDPKGFAEAICCLLENPEQIDTQSHAAWSNVKQNYDIGQNAKNVIQFLKFKKSTKANT